MNPDPDAPFREQRRNRLLGWLLAAVWLFFLNVPIATALGQPEPARRILGVGALLAFAVAYMLIFEHARRRRQSRRALPAPRSWGMLALLLGLGLLSIPGAEGGWMATLVYFAAAAVMLLPPVAALAVVAVAAVVPMAATLLVPSWESETGVSFAVLLAAFAVFGVNRLAQRNAELQAAQQEIRRLAVAEERARTARDLHDILGHSLTVVAVKAELAGRLVAIDPERAAQEITEVERLAREALADVRRTVGAYRGVTLTGELAGARTALAAADIAADVPADPPPLAPDRDELFGWTIREGVTNVVRHSGARHCVIRVAPDRVEVRDDGRGPVEAPGPAGHGLLGLRERAERMGARVTVGSPPDGPGFLLRVDVAGGVR